MINQDYWAKNAYKIYILMIIYSSEFFFYFYIYVYEIKII